ncbi:MAG: DsbC family protein [Legionellales bacterium]|nr:DsbC family protein [Legionellales bacterium]
MKHTPFISKVLLFAAVIGLSISAQAGEPSHQTIRQGLAGTQIDSITATPIQGVYAVKAGDNLFYSDNTGRYLIFGHLYDTATQTDLTTDTPGLPNSNAGDSSAVIAWKSLPLDSAIITGKKGGTPVAVFLDPDCPYCKVLQQDLLKNNALEVYEFLMPIAELHPEAVGKTEAVWCAADRAKALTSAMLNPFFGQDSASVPECDLSGLMKIKDFATSHHFNATPILIRQDGVIHYGYLSLSELTAWAMAGNKGEGKA